MHSYYQTELFQALISAARSPVFAADSKLQTAYNQRRYGRALRALRSRNVFLYTEGQRTSVNLNNTNTIYTQPAGVRLLLCGYADNLRYGAVKTSVDGSGANPTDATLLQMHRVRIVGGIERALVKDLVPAQAGVSGQPRYTSTQLVAPTILEADEQIAIDLGYDAAGNPEPTNIPPQAFIFFCLKVKDKLTAQDEEIVADIQRFIEVNPFQRGVFLNCAALNSLFTGLSISSAAGDIALCETPPVNVPTLITGIGTNLIASRITIIDTADGSSFSLNRPMQSSALNMPGYENLPRPFSFGAPVVTPIWASYYRLTMPHLLRRGALLKAEIVNGGDSGAGPNTVTEQGLFTQLIFQGVTV